MTASPTSGQTSESLGRALIKESCRRLFDESHARIRQCVALLNEDEIWYRPNAHTVSIGNWVLHLSGNIRQWIVSGLGRAPDVRARDAEFSEPGPIPTEELLAGLDATMRKAKTVLEAFDPTRLLEGITVQGQQETGLTILVHVVEHASYHTGQISYAVKSRKDLDLGYYATTDLNAKNG